MNLNHSCESNPEPSGAHHWVLPEPQGPYTLGTCKFCQKQRKFANAYEDIQPQSKPPKVEEAQKEKV